MYTLESMILSNLSLLFGSAVKWPAPAFLSRSSPVVWLSRLYWQLHNVAIIPLRSHMTKEIEGNQFCVAAILMLTISHNGIEVVSSVDAH